MTSKHDSICKISLSVCYFLVDNLGEVNYYTPNDIKT